MDNAVSSDTHLVTYQALLLFLLLYLLLILQHLFFFFPSNIIFLLLPPRPRFLLLNLLKPACHVMHNQQV